MKQIIFTVIATAGLCLACAPDLSERRAASTTALSLLSDSRFDEAGDAAEKVLEADGENPFAAMVLAIVRYKETMHNLFFDGQAMVIGGALTGQFSARMAQVVLMDADKGLVSVEKLIDIAAMEPDFSMDFCLACMEVDWNRSGEMDERDRTLLEVELDQHGEQYREDDPRRRPVFRFDHGDVLWAGAFVSFQRALLNLASAYDFGDLARLIRGNETRNIVLKLEHPERIARAREQILKGLSLSGNSRDAILAETDDEREWLPSPSQKDHPLPMPVDVALYDTWGHMVTDLTRLVRGEEGLSVQELAQLGDHHWQDPPGGFLNIGEMLENPKDIVLNPERLERLIESDDEQTEREVIESALTDIFGRAYVDRMDASPIFSRLLRMKNEIDHGQESLERKLRYLLWIN